MHIKGGINGQCGNPLDKTDEGIFISKINSIGAARKDGRLRAGMRLLSVNGKSLLGATHQEAVEALRSCGDQINLVVCKGYNRHNIEKNLPESSNSRRDSLSSVSNSVNSLSINEDENQKVSFRQFLQLIFY